MPLNLRKACAWQCWMVIDNNAIWIFGVSKNVNNFCAIITANYLQTMNRFQLDASNITHPQHHLTKRTYFSWPKIRYDTYYIIPYISYLRSLAWITFAEVLLDSVLVSVLLNSYNNFSEAIVIELLNKTAWNSWQSILLFIEWIHYKHGFPERPLILIAFSVKHYELLVYTRFNMFQSH